MLTSVVSPAAEVNRLFPWPIHHHKKEEDTPLACDTPHNCGNRMFSQEESLDAVHC
uniref:Uncharacterized protein n=1 Tax=Physcomitrium patens TaxID=3218 RepID=A0A2K1KFR6_PHYPA|nr:hypothetical protein PHYPA_009001 [Physcomitrium patens]